jgi:hypothetical protein
MNANIFGKTSYKFFTTKEHMSKSFTYLKAINSIPKMNKLYELSQNQNNQIEQKITTK